MKEEKHQYTSPDGTVYESYEAYCNDPDLDMDLIQVKLLRGQRVPQNDFERALLRELQQGRREGKFFEIYPN